MFDKTLSCEDDCAQVPPGELGRVFIIQAPRPRKSDGWIPNFEPATRYGRLEFIFEVADKAFADPTSAMEKAAEKLADFNPERDYLLWPAQGDPATCFVVLMFLCRYFSYPVFTLRFLYWTRGQGPTGRNDNARGYYFPIEITSKY